MTLQPHSSSSPSSTGSLPTEVTDAARNRLAIAAAVTGGVWLLYYVLFTTVWADASNAQSRIISYVTIPVSFLLAKYMYKCERASHVMWFGAAYEIFTCLAISMSEAYGMPHWEMTPQASWICPVILFFPALLPASPRAVLVDSMLAASMGPVGYGLFIAFGGEGTSDASTLISMWLPGYVSALLAVVPAKVMHGLGTDVKKARRMGSYQLVERLGQGGMGEVWRAKHRMLVRPAAIKLIRPDAGNVQRLRARFEREAQTTALLESPHTVQLYDFGVSDDGAFYYVMELLRGIDLDTLVKQFGPVPANRAVHLLVQACDSLDDAHRAGLVHRDIKPANTYAALRGRRVDFVKVLDFGLVTAGRDAIDVNTTAEGAVIGTPAYMAPEMTTGKHEIDGRADIYSLACVGWWLLTGEHVFDADTPMQMAIAHATSEPPAPSTRTANAVPPALDDVLLAALAKDPSARPATALEFAARLQAACAGEPAWSDEQAQTWWDAHLAKQLASAGTNASGSESAAAFLNPLRRTS